MLSLNPHRFLRLVTTARIVLGASAPPDIDSASDKSDRVTG